MRKNIMGYLLICSIAIMLTRMSVASSPGIPHPGGQQEYPDVGKLPHWHQRKGHNSSASIHTTRQFNLGMVNGKQFYADNTKHTNWRDAVRHCSSLGLELASIDTPQEWDLLRDSLEKVSALEWVIFWIAGRESRSVSMFNWDNSHQPLNPAVVKYFNIKFIESFDYSTCLTLYNIPRGSSETSYGIYPFSCFVGNNVLCQYRAG